MNPHLPGRLPTHGELCRRAFLGQGLGLLGALGMGSLLGRTALADEAAPGFLLPQAKAKRLVLVFLNGGISHLDTFDEKPLLNKRRGEEVPESLIVNRSVLDAMKRQGTFPVIGSKFEFGSHGKSGLRISELAPHIAKQADRLAIVKTMRTDHVLHESAISVLLTGVQLPGRPSWGSWISYALGRIDENVPEFVCLLSNGRGDSPLQPRLWHSGFLPGEYQGIRFRSGASPVLDLKNPPGVGDTSRKGVLDAIKRLNELEAETSGDPDVTTRIQAYEMAARMQTSVPELTDLKAESPETLAAYGADPAKPSFANNCVLARRLLERGSRFVQVMDGGWDHHGNVPRELTRKMRQVDQPIGALIGDLAERGLLDDTLVVVTSEFGRSPHCQGGLDYENYGRDHHSNAGATLLAGGGIRGGMTYGETDEWGWDAVEDPMHVHDLQATALHCLGLDHERLVFRHQGRDFRLTDVGGTVATKLMV